MQLLTSLGNRLFIAAQSSSSSSLSPSSSSVILVIHINTNTIHELNININNTATTTSTTTSTTTTTTTTNSTNSTIIGNNEHHTKQLKQQHHNEINYIYCSNDGRYVFASLVNKHLYCWEYTDDKYVLVSSTILKKRPTSIVHTVIDGYGLDSKKDILFVSDKAGDVWSIDVPLLKKQVLVSGHCASVITDMAVHQLSNVNVLPTSHSNENITSLIATADRDEKIRITCFPNMVTIMSYCLGHTNVVTSIAFFTINQKLFLISGAWDHSYIIWDPITGQALDKVSMIGEAQIKSIEQEQQSNSAIETEEKVEDNDDEDDDDKQYNEEVAGNYPLKIRVTTSPSPLAAIIFRRLPTIKLYVIEDDGKFWQCFDLTLPLVPVDVSFLQGQEEKKSSLYNDKSKVYLGHLAVLLPQPECVQVFEIYKDNGKIQSIPSTPFSELLETFKNDCVKQNITFEQVTGFGDENAGMNRDALDRPFKKEVIDISNRKHNKRSKRKLEEVEDEKK